MFDTLPALDPSSRIDEALRELAGEERSGWSGAAHSAHVLHLLATREAVEAELIRAVGDWEASGAWAEEGAAGPVGWLRSRGALPEPVASRLVQTARLAHEHEPTREALRSGLVPTANLAAIAQTVTDRQAAYWENPGLLLGPAASMPPAEFGKVTKRWRAVADDALAAADAKEQHDRRYLHASVTLGGMVALDALLDPEGGATFLAALGAIDTPEPVNGPVPPRSSAQRRADGLVTLAAESLDREARGGRAPVTVDVVIDLATLTGETPLDLASMRCDLDRVGPVPRSVVDRLLCDCSVGRVLMRGKSEVLDLGHRTRLASAAQRRALVHRDGGCAFPGCDRPHRWCDAHHLVRWPKGPTDLDNLALLCRRHHVLCHEGGWQLARGPDGTFTASPPPHPRRPDPRTRGPDGLTLAA